MSIVQKVLSNNLQFKKFELIVATGILVIKSAASQQVELFCTNGLVTLRQDVYKRYSLEALKLLQSVALHNHVLHSF